MLQRPRAGEAKTTSQSRYRYERGTDGCDETFDIYAPDEKRPMVSIAFWEAEAKAEATACRIVAALNACEGISTDELERVLKK
jgi:hypothetical protein